MAPRATTATKKKTTRAKTTKTVSEPTGAEVAEVVDGQGESDQPSDGSPVKGGMVTADGQPLATAEVTFRGRTMTVRVPDEGQLAVIQRFGEEYSTVGDREVEASVAIRMSRRAILVVNAVLAEEEDRDYIAEGVLAGDFKIWEVMPIINEALELLKEVNAPNREQRRAASKKSRLVTE